MKNAIITTAALLMGVASFVPAQGSGGTTRFDKASASVRQGLLESTRELAALRQKIAAEKIPLSRKLSQHEAELITVTARYQKVTRLLDTRVLDLENLRGDIKARTDEITYLSNLLGEYVRQFESRLHIAELQRYKEALGTAKLAVENTSLGPKEVFQAQAGLVTRSLDRLFDALGGTLFKGRAVDRGGLVNQGTFALLGPCALFRTADGRGVGTAEQRLGSLEPTVIGFADPADEQAAGAIITDGQGAYPFDPTMGNAHKIEATQESLVEHVKKGGPVMIPIFGLAGAALLVALYKYLTIAFLRRPTPKQLTRLLEAVGSRDKEAAIARAREVNGPAGDMLVAGAEHLGEERDLIEEVMYENVLTTKLRVQKLLPFIAIAAASAPLLGLLGTVTGIINTFKLITVFGSGDVKTLSGGISEALITTKFGLIVAIPSLLIHAYLARKARGVVGFMEKAAVSFINQVSKYSFARPGGRGVAGDVPHTGPAVPDPELVKGQVTEILREMLGPLNAGGEVGKSQGS